VGSQESSRIKASNHPGEETLTKIEITANLKNGVASETQGPA